MASKNWIPIRVQTEPAKMKFMKTRIETFTDVQIKRYFQLLQYIFATYAEAMRMDIAGKDYATPTGYARVARGGPGPGRIVTGAMIKGVKWRGRKISDSRYLFEIGWLDGRPGYAIFQEYGTKNGVKAMKILATYQRLIAEEIRLYGANRNQVRTPKMPNPSGRGGIIDAS